MPNLLPFQHGVGYQEVPTSIVATVEADSAVPVLIGLAPVHTLPQFQWRAWNGSGASPYASVVNIPILTQSFNDVVNGSAPNGSNALGYSSSFWPWTISAHVNEAYLLNNLAPAIYINVFDPSVAGNYQQVAAAPYNISNSQVTINQSNVILTSVVVQNAAKTVTYVNNQDYSLSYLDMTFGVLVLTVFSAGAIGAATQLSISYAYAIPSNITATQIIGGTTAADLYTGIQAVEYVFPLFNLVPGILLAPGFTGNSAVAQALLAKAENINGVFSCMVYGDVPSSAASGITNFGAVNAWKNQNNITSKYQYYVWPLAQLAGVTNWGSVKAAVTTGLTDWNNNLIPYVSPSNKRVSMDTPIVGDTSPLHGGVPAIITPANASYLNSIGIATFQNFIGGWKLWGNQTCAYPADTDIHDEFLPIQRMFQFIGNTLVLTLWQYVDAPGNERNVEAVLGTIQTFLSSLIAAQALIDGTAHFNPADNSLENLMNGTFTFRLEISPPPPMQFINVLLEYDLAQLAELFASTGLANPT